MDRQLRRQGIFGEIQEFFKPDHRSLREVLRNLIRDCDAVICLVGFLYGESTPEQPDRSYTQLEYDVATELGKPIFVFLANEGCDLDSRLESTQKRRRQLAHRTVLMQEHACQTFASETELELKVASALPQIMNFQWGGAPVFVNANPDPSLFVGREQEMEQLQDALSRDSPSTILVLGMSGVGKSTLVLQCLRRLGDGNFFAGFWFTADRGIFTFDAFLDEALKYFMGDRFDKRTMPKPEERSRELLSILQEHRAWVVIDGCERWLSAWMDEDAGNPEGRAPEDRGAFFDGLDAFLAGFAAISSGSHLVVTSRAIPAVLDSSNLALIPIREASAAGLLQGLDPESAAALLGSLGVHGNREELKQIASSFDFHPLALRVLGQLLSKRYGGELDRMPNGVECFGGGALKGLFEEVRGNFPGGATAESLLRAVSLSWETIELEGIAFILGRTSRECVEVVRKQVVSLADWNLIEWDSMEEQITLHPLVAQFFGNIDSPPEKVRLHKRFLALYYDEPIPLNPTTLAEVRGRSLAVRHGRAAGDIHRCASMVFGQFIEGYTFIDWLAEWGHFELGRQLLGELAEVAKGELRASFLLARSGMSHSLNLPLEAGTDLQDAVSVLEEIVDDAPRCLQALGRCLCALAGSQRIAQRSSDAVRNCNEAIDALIGVQEPDDEVQMDIAQAKIERGIAFWDLGHWRKAVSSYDEALGICDGIDPAVDRVRPRMLRATALSNRAGALSLLGKEQEAVHDMEVAIWSLRQLPDADRPTPRLRLAEGLSRMGAILDSHGHAGLSLPYHEESIAIAEVLARTGRHDAEYQIAVILMNRARRSEHLGAWKDVVADANRSIALFDGLIRSGRMQLDGMRSSTLLSRAHAYYLLGDKSLARTDRERALDAMRHLWELWLKESDIALVYVQRLRETILYLERDGGEEHDYLLDELRRRAQEVEDCVELPEEYRAAVRGCLEWQRPSV